jgi:hypothetical protein
MRGTTVFLAWLLVSRYVTEGAGKMDAFCTSLGMATAVRTVDYECNDDSVLLAMNIFTTQTTVFHKQMEGQCCLFIDVFYKRRRSSSIEYPEIYSASVIGLTRNRNAAFVTV